MKSLHKEPTVIKCLLILDLKPFKLEVKGNHSIDGIPEYSCARKESVDIDIVVKSRNGDRKIMQSIRITSRSPTRKRNQLSQF